MDPQLLNAAGKIANSPTTETIAKRLWPSMLFVIIMTIIAIGMLAWFTKEGTSSRSIGFWLLFLLDLALTALGAYVMIMDARILNAQDRINALGGQGSDSGGE
ncbi:hypothetical protein [Paenibacillus sp. NPDC058177]|uniref:hypothetical protein n=1 Tax=Paenibacillus sp. NPDC058177 TaxID=3346369 RepID=UPI0036D819E4